MFDDLGSGVKLTGPPHRVVSLVPSLTEAIAVTVPGVLVGATDWCTRPPGLKVIRVRGTKNPNLTMIDHLRPDLVVASQEENRRVDVERLRAAGIPVWVTRIDGVDESLDSMGRLFREVFGAREVAWLDEARRVWNLPPSLPGARVAVPVWRDPWIWVGASTYAHDVLRRLGCENVAAALGARYPHSEPSAVLRRRPDLILLPDEPYPFSASEAPGALAPARILHAPGRALFWYGPAMVTARGMLDPLGRTALP